MLALLGVTCFIQGERPSAQVSSVLFVANHSSWLDILAINATHPCRFLAKAEVREWPVIGWLAWRTGTIFIRRGHDRDMERATRTMITALRRGQCVAIFPEGTTSDGSALLPFHPGLFQSAIDSESTLWPVAIRYVQEDRSGHRATAFVGELSLVTSVWRILRAAPIRLIIHYDKPLFDPVQDRRLLADSTYRAIASLLPTVPSHRSPDGLPYNIPAGSVLS